MGMVLEGPWRRWSRTAEVAHHGAGRAAGSFSLLACFPRGRTCTFWTPFLKGHGYCLESVSGKGVSCVRPTGPLSPTLTHPESRLLTCDFTASQETQQMAELA